ncbi:hypothetical protein PMIN02_001505 [Paraphaeosphaeria minitans]|uniref:J domain-containing protein n=1 Tax=Paraphaeosphaeria minitans TaxID=565426 RepID=A0A9P6KSB4_9PLEO|nr:hypothetical protein PMIN01_04871 [Paraphaeosphaeria minitans]
MEIRKNYYAKTLEVLESLCVDERTTITQVQTSNMPAVKEKKKKIIEHHMAPEVIKKTVDKHVYLPAPKLVVQKKEIIRHVEPERIKNVINKHVYLPEPVLGVEHIIHYHQGAGIRQTYSTSYGSYGESSKSVEKRPKKHVKIESEESDSSDTEKYSSSRKGKGNRKQDDDSESEEKYSGKGKGKRKEDRGNRRDDSRRRNRDRKRSSSRSGRKDRDDRSRNSKKEHTTRSRSRTRSPSRRRSSHRRSPSAGTHKGSSEKKRVKSHTREPEPQSSDQEDEDAYYGSDTDNSDPKVPHSSTREAESPSEEKPASSFDPYAALGLQDKPSTIDQIDIDAAYKFLVRKWHPDRHMSKSKKEQDKATERTAELNRAHDILGIAGRKKVFDRTGKTELWELDQLVEKGGCKGDGDRSAWAGGGEGTQ